MITPEEQERPSRRASKIIAAVEKRGGFILKCGCFVPVRAKCLRQMMAWTSPEEVIELEGNLTREHERDPVQGKCNAHVRLRV